MTVPLFLEQPHVSKNTCESARVYRQKTSSRVAYISAKGSLAKISTKARRLHQKIVQISRKRSMTATEEAKFSNGKEKAIAACAGALVTSLTMTPFDVVKTRLQTQNNPEPKFMPSSHMPPPTANFRLDASTSKVKLPSSSLAATNLATCCQTTFFTTNMNQDSLLCKFDPRISVSTLPSTGSARMAAAAQQFPVHALPSAKALGKRSTVRTLYYAASSVSAVAAAEACAFPNPSTAASSLPGLSQPSARHFTGFLDAFSKIVRYEGMSALWRGVGPAMAMSIPSQASYMVGYDFLRQYIFARPIPIALFRDAQTGEYTKTHKVVVPLVAGSAARAAVVTIFSPIELLRTRMQSVSTITSTEVIRLTMQEIRSNGVRSLWRGLPATLWRDVPFSGIYWAAYEVMQRTITGSGFGEAVQNDQAGSKTFATAFICGAVSGSVAATITNPFDVIKTRRQASASGSASTFTLIGDILKREGLAGMARGLTPRLAKVAPACGLMISFYEIGLRYGRANNVQAS